MYKKTLNMNLNILQKYLIHNYVYLQKINKYYIVQLKSLFYIVNNEYNNVIFFINFNFE